MDTGRSVAIGSAGRDTEQVTSHSSAADPAVTERIDELLRARGLRRMASRLAVLAVLGPVQGHLSVAEIHRRLVAALQSINRPRTSPRSTGR